MSIRWSADDNSYCYFIVPLFLYLLWDRHKIGKRDGTIVKDKHKIRFGELSWNLAGFVPVVFSICLIIIGEFGSAETLLYIGLWGCTVGLIIVFFGTNIRHLIFPLVILLFVVPLPPFINSFLTFQLKLAASSFSTALLRAIGVSVLREGNIIDLGIYQLQVVDACSGLRYFIPLFLMGLLSGYFFNKGFWERTIVCLIVAPMSIIINAIRICVTGLLTVNGYQSMAESFFHNFSGFVVFLIGGGFLVVSSLTLKKIGKRSMERGGIFSAESDLVQTRSILNHTDFKTKPQCPMRKGSATQIGGLFKPAIVATALCLLFASSGWALKQIPSARYLPERMSFLHFPLEIGTWQGKRHDISEKILNGLWTDDYISVTYRKPDSKNYINLFIPFYEYQTTRHTAHAPQSCMLGSGWALFDLSERQIKMEPGEKLKMLTMTWEKGNYKLLGSYFFFQRGRVITNPWKNKLYLIWDAVTKGRTDGALVRVELMVAPGQSNEDAYKELKEFIVKLWPILPDYVPE